ncbi:MAG TPA: exodeoxyribonuclease VII large subunit [Gammaproteobacteria bacterium]|nr:exodeoxyribonuclease VII large subunit [Gammaproteobacteria bacterium]
MSADGKSADPARIKDVYTVSRLNLEVKSLIESSYPPIWVEGEISNLARPRSGHIYFSLKDDNCQVRCAMFRMQNRQLEFDPEDGLQVLANARVSLYPERGEFQLIVKYMEEAGAGALRRAFEALKQRLAAEGLFDEEKKRPLPEFPRTIGVVTSPTGAALRDILHVIQRRHPGIRVVIYPVPVQGAQAAPEIVRMIGVAGARKDCEVLIVARGGGSIEDLWAFNDEQVARAIRACPVPVVTGIGHEVDFTIADFAADRRAPTPSAAAELVTPDVRHLIARIGSSRQRLTSLIAALIRNQRENLDWLSKRLLLPRRRLLDFIQRVDELNLRLNRSARGVPVSRRAALAALKARLSARHPAAQVHLHRARHVDLRRRLRDFTRRRLSDARARISETTRALNSISPMGTLERGYSILTRAEDGALVSAADSVQRGERVHARLAKGELDLTVEGKKTG